jgi:hypothetical protein
MANLLNDKLIIKPLSDKIIIVDNFLSEHVVGHLRLRMEFTNKFHDIYKDYQAINFLPGKDLITDILQKEISNKFNLNNFQRAWSFIYDNTAQGVDFHADPSSTNVNIWLTPDESIENFSQNGLIICNKKPPENWTREQWNGNKNGCIDKFLEEQKASFMRINYRCNRAIFFDGALFHKTDNVKTKYGNLNKRVSYTMLFGSSLE